MYDRTHYYQMIVGEGVVEQSETIVQGAIVAVTAIILYFIMFNKRAVHELPLP